MSSSADKYFSLLKSIILVLMFASPTVSSADGYSVDSILSLERRLYELRSEISITTRSTHGSQDEQAEALYYITSQSWEKSLRSILPADLFSSPENKHYTSILYGISSQGLGENKEALNYYSSVPLDSGYYAVAQLNIALMSMRDGDAEKAFDTINRLLADDSLRLDRGIKNRASFILGSLYLKEDNYQKARAAFRNVEANSTYSNRAVIGLSLSALYLGDYDAAQHSLLSVKDQAGYDLAADESFLILAFIHESAGRYGKAVAAYEHASAHYEERQKIIDSLLHQKKPLIIDEVINNHIFVVSENQIDLLGKLPDTFFEHYMLLKKLLRAIKKQAGMSNRIYERATLLYSDYNVIINNLLKDQLSVRYEMLSGYLKQSNYGLVLSNDKLLLKSRSDKLLIKKH